MSDIRHELTVPDDYGVGSQAGYPPARSRHPGDNRPPAGRGPAHGGRTPDPGGPLDTSVTSGSGALSVSGAVSGGGGLLGGSGLHDRGSHVDGDVRSDGGDPSGEGRPSGGDVLVGNAPGELRTPSRGSSPAGGGGLDEEVLLARAYLSRVAEPPAPGLAAFVAEVGPVRAAELVRLGAVPERVATETVARRGVDRAAADLAAGAAAGARLLTPEHVEWPAAFADFAATGVAELAPPVALWVRGPGHLGELSARAVAVVGARAATGYGMHVAGEFGAGLADGGYAVVSGGAIGIDGAAHRGALAVDGPTVAALACGVDRAYPRAHETLLARIAASGLVVSEYPPGSVPARHRFLVRNRLIAGLAAGTVVVEAGLRSGATRTATDAGALGRQVMAVPGPITSGLSAGCHRLVRDGGALLVSRIEEVLEAVGPIGAQLAEDPGVPRRDTDALDTVGMLVHDALPTREARDTGWLAMEAGVPVGAVRVVLVDLERRGLVEHRDGLWRRPSRPQGR